MHLRKPFVVHLNSFLLMDVKLVIQVVHHLFASRCKCVLIVPIKLRGIITILYRVIPKMGINMKLCRSIAKIDKRLQRDVKRRCSKSGIRQKIV